MINTDKRRNWTQEDDIALLIQVAADHGKKVQHRFLTLVDEHRKFDAASARLSGVDEEEKEKHMLLDDIVTLMDDLKTDQQKHSQVQDEKRKLNKVGLSYAKWP
ncbi:hypothetical protein H257_14753 [Aphanomyces astaci]|uniref:Myb-like domain-containing protein n=1 Tax=Aphanomyces astaci TaxID=112090 RepID=W4FS25_APHAT|nr:hypothetical protein H257_14753 [Aphanomyces astaci]ETV69614.1 hypothetical protein H257_14753 [Aphanomyces astaci]|eukprot:XP_009840941.1 hypothetical protein H257_14753 [Aphanomyces astaci]